MQPATSRLETKVKRLSIERDPRTPRPRRLQSQVQIAHNFTNEFIKIGYAGSFLGGPPSDWWHTLFQRYEESQKNGTSPPAELTSFSEFANALTNSYGDPDLTGTMERELRTLRQTGSVSAYAAEFQRIAGFLIAAGWNDRPLLSNFRANLKDNIKNVLVHEKPFPTTLQEMIAASIRIDNREHEKIMDRKLPTHQSGTQGNQSRSHQNGPSRLQITAPTNPVASTLPLPIITPVANNDGTTPMELDAFERRVLTDAEREFRRSNKLCHYCGGANHRIADCPKIPEKRVSTAESTLSPNSLTPTRRQQTLAPKSDLGALFGRNLPCTPFKHSAVPSFIYFSFIISFAWLRTFLVPSKSPYYSQNQALVW